MKYLSNYTEEAQTKLFDECGAFFAFGQKQLEEKKVSDVEYVSLGHGLICPKANVKVLSDGLDNIQEKGIKQDIAENGKSAIIHRELANHEAQITMSISDTIGALDGYGFTTEEIEAEFKKFFDHCVENDLF